MGTVIRGFACAASLCCAVLIVAGPAGAGHVTRPGPQEGNVPLLAWRGEEIRLVKCFDVSAADVTGEWQIMDWSGDAHVWPRFFDDNDQRTPVFFPNYGEEAGRGCFAIDITSHKPGIGIVKLTVEDPGGVPGGGVPGEGDPAFVHRFNMIWMTLEQPILRHLEGGAGGPAGPITTNPDVRSRLGVVIKGRVPLNNQFRTELGAQRPALNADSIVVPDAWPELARTSLTAKSDFWDIHDSTGPYNPGSLYGPISGNAAAGGDPLAGSVAGVCEAPPTDIATAHEASCHVTQGLAGGGDADCNGDATIVDDTVDNCDDGEFSTFSRIFHDVSGPPTIGPYTPTRPDETMLSDGLLNIHDAPMPAAAVVANIAPNAGATDVGGVGSLESVDKHLVYNRSGAAGSNCVLQPDAKHCLTGPFYGAYIPPSPTMESNPAELPATLGGQDDPDTASGIHGTFANDLEGHYLPVSYLENLGLYHYWDIVRVHREAVGTASTCRDAEGPRLTPSGAQEIALYTDEHGEAQFQFNAGLGFYFDNLGLTPNSDGGCDLEGVTVLGTARVQANARYPLQSTTSAGVTSNTLSYDVHSLYGRELTCLPEGPDSSVHRCTATTLEIDGAPPSAGEVCFSTDPGPAEPECISTDTSGRASLDITAEGVVEVTAEFADAVTRTALIEGADTTPPLAFALSNPSPGLQSASGRPSFDWEASSDTGSGLSHYQLLLDGSQLGANIPAGTTSFTPSSDLAEGAHSWQVRAVDAVGNARTSTARTFTIDTTPPLAFALSSPGPGLQTASARPSFNWEASSDTGSSLSHYQLLLDGNQLGTNIPAGTTSFTPSSDLAEGAHSWQVRAVDAVGNARTSASRTFLIDTVAPETTLTSGPSSTTRYVLGVFSFASSELPASFECSVDGLPWVPCSSPYMIATASEGLHLFRVRAGDFVGNLDPTEASFIWRVDTTTPPTARLSATKDVLLTDESVTLDGSASTDAFDGSIVKYEWDLDNNGVFEIVASDATSQTISYSLAGESVARLRVTNTLGTVGVAVTKLDVRRRPPLGSPSIVINRGAKYTNGRAVNVSVRWPAYTSQFVVSGDASFAQASELSVTDTFVWTFPPSALDGRRSIFIRFRGSPSEAASFHDEITLDRKPPSLNSVSSRVVERPKRSGRGLYQLFLAANDVTSGIGSMQLTESRKSPVAWRPFARTRRVRTSAKTLWVRLRDHAGNISPWKPLRLQHSR